MFESFSKTPSGLTKPQIVGTEKSFLCRDVSIAKLNIKKRMFWCDSRRYNKIKSDEYGEEQGFFCAGSRRVDGRVFALRPPEMDSVNVSPVGELDDVDEILQYVPRYFGSRKGSSSTSSSGKQK